MAGASGSIGGSVLTVGEASGPSGGGSGIFPGETGVEWHADKEKSVVRQRSKVMVVRRIVFISKTTVSFSVIT